MNRLLHKMNTPSLSSFKVEKPDNRTRWHSITSIVGIYATDQANEPAAIGCGSLRIFPHSCLAAPTILPTISSSARVVCPGEQWRIVWIFVAYSNSARIQTHKRDNRNLPCCPDPPSANFSLSRESETVAVHHLQISLSVADSGSGVRVGHRHLRRMSQREVH